MYICIYTYTYTYTHMIIIYTLYTYICVHNKVIRFFTVIYRGGHHAPPPRQEPYNYIYIYENLHFNDKFKLNLHIL